ncbi:MAG: hypothetical protein AB1641_27425 [Thermodesulfobacteriota bacterium]
MRARLWLLTPALIFFLIFGIFMLLTAYHQNHPTVFLALFFSSSLIILLCLAGLVGLVWRAYSRVEAVESEPVSQPATEGQGEVEDSPGQDSIAETENSEQLP